MARQDQIKQVWVTKEDEALFAQLADNLRARGIDVEPETKSSKSPYSYTKIIRWLLHEATQQK